MNYCYKSATRQLWAGTMSGKYCRKHKILCYHRFSANFYAFFTPPRQVFINFLLPARYSSLCKKSMGKHMDYLMEILYVGGLGVFFLLVWALIQACDKLGAKA
ncbi:hypothetical protein ACO0LM_17375 [Undibacterium sp. Di26W]|uniref:hypothetical protein n=1 Tax=Undibacterium sp. Di26W TaxID=3413035 RepID=UPI003BF23596